MSATGVTRQLTLRNNIVLSRFSGKPRVNLPRSGAHYHPP
jgi:hypothetical protein